MYKDRLYNEWDDNDLVEFWINDTITDCCKINNIDNHTRKYCNINKITSKNTSNNTSNNKKLNYLLFNNNLLNNGTYCKNTRSDSKNRKSKIKVKN
jgi:hypothetical protein